MILCGALAAAAGAMESEECLLCHEEADLTGVRDGAEISVHVDPDVFAASIHGDWDCVSCHVDLEGVDMHDDDVEPVDCGACHAEAEEMEGARHGRFAATNER